MTAIDGTFDEERAALVALHASLPFLTPVQAASIARFGAHRALATLRAGRVPDEIARLRKPGLEAAWVSAARGCDPEAIVDRHRRGGVWVAAAGDVDWPFDHDPAAPTLVFGAGDRGLFGRRPAVAIVGTRRCTAIGRRVASELGRELSAAGVTVLSGLALGIDGAAHRGVIDGGGAGAPVAVVAGGVDVVYPRRHGELFAAVRSAGLIISEAALGIGVEPWRFLARNRMIAALADVVVVVESHARGGALATAGEAATRGVEVAAVPGSVLSAASDGTNELLRDGAVPVRHAADVLEVLGSGRPDFLGGSSRPPDGHDRARSAPTPQRPRPDLDPLEAAVLAEVLAGTDGLEALGVATGRAIPDVLSAVTRLQLAGEIERDGGRVVPRVGDRRNGDGAPTARNAPLR